MMLSFKSYGALIFALIALVGISQQWVGPDEVDAHMFDRPMVLPSSERALHSIYIEYNTLAKGNQRTPKYAIFYLALIEDQLTFGGHDVELPASYFPGNSKKCALFLSSNSRHDRCDEDYFVLHNDLVDLSKQVFNAGDSLETICEKKVKELRPKMTYKEKNNFVMKYGSRVLMMYLRSLNDNKCIGTYDYDEDRFTCNLADKETGGFTQLKIDNFLHDPTTGNFRRGKNSVEIFCRLPHVFP